MLTDLTNDENYIYVEAHPEYYDSMESLAINTETKEFEICEGGGQHISKIYKGTADYSQPDTLVLHYTREEQSKTDMDYTISFRYSIENTQTKHFNGYELFVSNYTTTFDRSLLTPPDQATSHEHDPLIFYTVTHTEECDVDLYRAKHCMNRDKHITPPQQFAQYVNKTITDEILSEIVKLRKKHVRNSRIDKATILGASQEGILLYYKDYEFFMFLAPTVLQYYIDDVSDDERALPLLAPNMKHTFEYDISSNKDTIEDIVNLYHLNTQSEDVKEFVEEVTKLFV